MKITIKELIEKDGRWYGGVSPPRLIKFGTSSMHLDGAEDPFWKTFNDNFSGVLYYPLKKGVKRNA